MSKIDEVRSEMVAAMKAGNKERKEALSMLLSALKNMAIDKREDLTEEEENSVILKEIKQTRETLDTTPSSRQDIIGQCNYRISVLEEFAPKMLDESAIKAVILDVIGSLGIDTPTAKDKGRIMKDLIPRIKGQADGKLVNEVLGTMMQP